MLIFRNIIFSLILLSTPAFAQDEISRVDVGELTYVLLGENNEYSLLISPTSKTSPLSKNLTANAFSVKSPSRLVIDIPQFSEGKSKDKKIDDKNVSSFRVGVHSEKTRLVIDLKNNVIPQYEVVANPKLGAIVVSFNLNNGSSNSEKIVDKTKMTPEKIITEPIGIKQLEKKQPKLSTETFVVKGNTNKSNSALVTKILFEKTERASNGAIVISGKNLEGYKLNQKGPNLFELQLENANLDGEHLSLPQFPPESFNGFEVVLANQKNSDVIVKIYVNDGVTLSPYLAGGKLYIKTN